MALKKSQMGDERYVVVGFLAFLRRGRPTHERPTHEIYDI
jgi:hypothetical protein